MPLNDLVFCPSVDGEEKKKINAAKPHPSSMGVVPSSEACSSGPEVVRLSTLPSGKALRHGEKGWLASAAVALSKRRPARFVWSLSATFVG